MNVLFTVMMYAQIYYIRIIDNEKSNLRISCSKPHVVGLITILVFNVFHIIVITNLNQNQNEIFWISEMYDVRWESAYNCDSDIMKNITWIVSWKDLGMTQESFLTLRSRSLGAPSSLLECNTIRSLGSILHGFPKIY